MPAWPMRRRQLRSLERLEGQLDRIERALAKQSRSAEKKQTRQPVVTLEHEGVSVRLLAPTKFASKRRNAAVKEPWTARWLTSLADGDVLWDVGANTGPYALLAASLPDRRLTVVAVEPAYAAYAVLCDNILLNRVEDRVLPLPVTLTAGTGTALVRYSDVSAGASWHGGGADLLEGESFRSAYDQRVLGFALDDLLAQFNLPAPTHVKLGVDGAELEVLSGGQGTLARTELRSVLVEVSRDQEPGVDQVLGAAGLTLVERHGHLDAHGQPNRLWYAVYDRER